MNYKTVTNNAVISHICQSRIIFCLKQMWHYSSCTVAKPTTLTEYMLSIMLVIYMLFTE